MKKINVIGGLIILSSKSIACEICVKQQPKILQSFAHGTGPDSNWDYLIVSIMAAIVFATFFFSLKFLVKPGEQAKDHIKHFILNHE